jgi:dUTP pyrophosphatase
MLLKVAKTHEKAILPNRANPSDAGADLYYCPADDVGLEVGPKGSVILSTGIKVEVPHGYMLEVKNRSSVAAKKSLLVGACVIDSGYSGEIFINLHNVGPKPKLILPGDKIAQVVLVPVLQWRSCVVEEKDLYKDALTISSRGTDALGSTN